MIFDYAGRYGEARAQLARWVAGGRLRHLEDILPGIEHAPDTIAGLYRGENRGKRLIRVSEDPTAPVGPEHTSQIGIPVAEFGGDRPDREPDSPG